MKATGLTLIELMVVLAVLAVLAGIAYPLYSAQTQKARRADAKIALENLAVAQERFYTINGNYALTLSSLQVSADIQGGASDEGYYNISLTLTGGNDQTFVASAQAAAGGSQASDDDCDTFSINQLGVKGAQNSAAVANPDCW